MTRFVVDCDTLLQIASGELDVAGEPQLLAPTPIVTSDETLACAASAVVETTSVHALRTAAKT